MVPYTKISFPRTVNQARIKKDVMVNIYLSFRTVFFFIIASLICLVNSNVIFADSGKSIQVIIDHLKIDADLIDFPIAVHISASCRNKRIRRI